jgi:hypothetical protein
VVTFAEGRFGICRLVAWLRDGDIVSVAMPADEYTALTRTALRCEPGGYNAAIVATLHEHGLLPTGRPTSDAAAPSLLQGDDATTSG